MPAMVFGWLIGVNLEQSNLIPEHHIFPATPFKKQSGWLMPNDVTYVDSRLRF
jgi:hypothetical protein